MKNISEFVEFRNRGVLVGSTYIISDLHIGYSDEIDAMTKEQESEEIASRLIPVIEENDVSEIIINGDIFHEFNAPSEGAREIFRDMSARIGVDEVELTTVRGNHDSAAVEEYPNLTDFEQFYKFQSDGIDVVVCHGHEEVDAKGDLFIIGHLHPMVKINGVNWPVYLFGESIYNSSDVLVSPAFNSYQDGVIVSDRMRLDIDFPMIDTSEFGSLQPFVYDENEDEVREFPKLRDSSEYFGI